MSIEVSLKIIAAFAAIIGGFIGLWKYFDTSKKEFRKPYWERQLTLYFEVTAAAATLATIDSNELDPYDREKLRREAQEKFWQLYYGPLEIVTDDDVTSAVVEVGKCLREYTKSDNSVRNLKDKSLDLARACRESISKSWNIELSALGNKRR
jgi:hypothetical protein